MLNLKNKKYCNHYTLCDIKFSTNPSQTFDSFDHAFPPGFNINTYEQLVKSAFHRSLLPNNYPSAANTEPERWAPSAIQLRFSQISTPHKTTYSIQLLSNKTPTKHLPPKKRSKPREIYRCTQGTTKSISYPHRSKRSMNHF
jgi:hypothetical protein